MRVEAAVFSGMRKGATRELLVQIRDIVNEILKTGDIVGQDGEGRTLIQLAVDPMMLNELCVYDSIAADLELDGDLEDEGI